MLWDSNLYILGILLIQESGPFGGPDVVGRLMNVSDFGKARLLPGSLMYWVYV